MLGGVVKANGFPNNYANRASLFNQAEILSMINKGTIKYNLGTVPIIKLIYFFIHCQDQ